MCEVLALVEGDEDFPDEIVVLLLAQVLTVPMLIGSVSKVAYTACAGECWEDAAGAVKQVRGKNCRSRQSRGTRDCGVDCVTQNPLDPLQLSARPPVHRRDL